MPKPGPRPYECVRRAWHSDRHQPMRGSLIQEIFRMANDIHSPATRKNKEWQEKLPCVVFKAEEIMYSKANSEAEYMDLKTLRERVNDAIDTIIRKDDTPESGLLLQPCIEAALNLGCVPRRASRSQRHNNPIHYLSPIAKDVDAGTSLNALDINRTIVGHGQPTPSDPTNFQNSPSQSTSRRPTLFNSQNEVSGLQQVKSIGSAMTSQPNDSSSVPNFGFAFSAKPHFLASQGIEPVHMETCTSSSVGRVYPLFYSESQPEVVSCNSFQSIYGTGNNTKASAPCFWSHEIGNTSYPMLACSTVTGSLEEGLMNMENSKEFSNTGCDLSLRLGLPSHQSFRGEHSGIRVHDDFRSSSLNENKMHEADSVIHGKWISHGKRPFYIDSCYGKSKGPCG